MLEAAPRAPAQRHLLDHVEQRGALVGAAGAGPKVAQHLVQAQPRRQRDLGLRRLERADAVDPVARALLRLAARELPALQVLGEARVGERALAGRLVGSRVGRTGEADDQGGQVRVPAVPCAADIFEAEFEGHRLLPRKGAGACRELSRAFNRRMRA